MRLLDHTDMITYLDQETYLQEVNVMLITEVIGITLHHLFVSLLLAHQAMIASILETINL